MTESRHPASPRNFFLNEQHELAHGEKDGHGRPPNLAPIDWETRGARLHRSIVSTRKRLEQSADPLRKKRFFMLTVPEQVVAKRTNAKNAPKDGIKSDRVDFAGEHARIFRRLGLDLLDVSVEGHATVHALPETLERLALTARLLGSAVAREQARWVAIAAFAPVPASLRVDDAWLHELSANANDAVIELQPVLARSEIETVLRAVSARLAPDRREKLTGIGTDFSGRHWVRATLTLHSVKDLAESFPSIQSLHPPLRTSVAVGKRGAARPGPVDLGSVAVVHDSRTLPVVAVVDLGIPDQHRVLSSLVRSRWIGAGAATQPFGDHGSRVASRAVFGDVWLQSSADEPPPPRVAVSDVRVGDARELGKINDKAVVPTLDEVARNAPDVRVFNLCFDDRLPLSQRPAVERRERALLVQDLDNFVFQRDAIVVVSAGNAPLGRMPNPPYPDHMADIAWSLGPWASGFNSLVCGSSVERLSPGGLVKQVGWPSAFSRLGPGLAKAPKPDFCAHGGNSTEAYRPGPGLGVSCLLADGRWDEGIGTSLAAPLLAREAALAFEALQHVCPSGTRPCAPLVKAFLSLTADPRELPKAQRRLQERALGRGIGSAESLGSPRPNTGLLLWQGILAGPDDVARVELPIPRAWLRMARSPVLRLIWSWDTPVTQAAWSVWGCRRVEVKVRPDQGAEPLRARARQNAYPIVERRYDLTKYGSDTSSLPRDEILVELSYVQVADYPITFDITPEQRIAFVAELSDDNKPSVSPQAALQAHPKAATMIRLSAATVAVAQPITVRVPV